MASNIFRGYNYLLSPRIDPWFAVGIGLTAAILRIRREETCHRLGLPSNSMVSLIEQERTKFDDTPSSRSRLSMTSWSLGDSREADILRQDAMRSKLRRQKADEAAQQRGTTADPASASHPTTTATTTTTATAITEPTFSSIPRGPELSRDPKTGELVLGPAPPGPYSGGASGGGDIDRDEEADDMLGSSGRALSKEEQRQRDAEFKQRFRNAQPSVLELGQMFGGRTRWFAEKCWREFWDRPWFWAQWGKGWDTWRTQSSEGAEEGRVRDR